MGMSCMGNTSHLMENGEPAGNPDPTTFNVLNSTQVGSLLVIAVQYPSCKNYEGCKIMVFRDMTLDRLLARRRLDPHFDDKNVEYSPIARFVPTGGGYMMALRFARSMDDSATQPVDEVNALKAHVRWNAEQKLAAGEFKRFVRPK